MRRWTRLARSAVFLSVVAGFTVLIPLYSAEALVPLPLDPPPPVAGAMVEIEDHIVPPVAQENPKEAPSEIGGTAAPLLETPQRQDGPETIPGTVLIYALDGFAPQLTSAPKPLAPAPKVGA